jgi:hypothetical protein
LAPTEWSRWDVSLRLAVALSVAGGAGWRSAAGHAAKAGTNTSGAGGLYPSDACGLIVLNGPPAEIGAASVLARTAGEFDGGWRLLVLPLPPAIDQPNGLATRKLPLDSLRKFPFCYIFATNHPVSAAK